MESLGLEPCQFPFAHPALVHDGSTCFVPLVLSGPREWQTGSRENTLGLDEGRVGARPSRDEVAKPAGRVPVVAFRSISSNMLFIRS